MTIDGAGGPALTKVIFSAAEKMADLAADLKKSLRTKGEGPPPQGRSIAVLFVATEKAQLAPKKRKGRAQGGRARERTHSGRSASTERPNRLPTPCFFLSRHGGHLGGSQCPLRLDPTVSSPFAEILPPWLLTSSNPLKQGGHRGSLCSTRAPPPSPSIYTPLSLLSDQ